MLDKDVEYIIKTTKYKSNLPTSFELLDVKKIWEINFAYYFIKSNVFTK